MWVEGEETSDVIWPNAPLEEDQLQQRRGVLSLFHFPAVLSKQGHRMLTLHDRMLLPSKQQHCWKEKHSGK